MSGKWFPTGCHKVGASFGCLAPRLVTGQFDATYHHAVWPSTGNYCRGGAFNSSCWHATPSRFCRRTCPRSALTGSRPSPARSSPPRLRVQRQGDLRQDQGAEERSQHDDLQPVRRDGQPLWHYNVTGYALADLFEAVKRPGDRFAGACFTPPPPARGPRGAPGGAVSPP